ncbi:hypothetical protein J422_01975 [Methanocaldococcus villosus KIN24-T80]|uniref:Uncharacterized protein n=2 Tax=Methanocaldococcus villosus TaxID=667126 RepID=N6V2R7_9EURY|nr:hypothetical protein J422_01975 [Methanocaldococcus villosus KIN24-T80]
MGVCEEKDVYATLSCIELTLKELGYL